MDCVTKLAVHYDKTIEEMHDFVSEWRYEYLTASYMLLLNKKHQKRPLRLAPRATPLTERHLSTRIDSAERDDVILRREHLVQEVSTPDSPFNDFARHRHSGTDIQLNARSFVYVFYCLCICTCTCKIYLSHICAVITLKSMKYKGCDNLFRISRVEYGIHEYKFALPSSNLLK